MQGAGKQKGKEKQHRRACQLACVQTSPVSFVSACNKGNRRRLDAGNLPAGYHPHSWVNFSELMYVINVDPFGLLIPLPEPSPLAQMLVLTELTRRTGHPCKLFVSRTAIRHIFKEMYDKKKWRKAGSPRVAGVASWSFFPGQLSWQLFSL